MELDELIKLHVGSVCKSTESVEILICNNTMVICIGDASLCIIDIGIDTNIYSAFKYGEDWKKSNENIYNKILGYWNYYDNISKCCPIIGSIDDLRSIPEYNNLIGRKASEGVGVYIMPSDTLYQSIWIPVFTGFPVLVKQDAVGVQIRRIDQFTLLLQYNIHKHKLKKVITQWCRMMDMNRPTKPKRVVYNI